MIVFDFFNLYYYLSQSLLGRITNNIIGISVERVREDKIILHVYVNSAPSVIEKENMFSALSETDSYFDTTLDYDVKFKTVEVKLSKNDAYNFGCFCNVLDSD